MQKTYFNYPPTPETPRCGHSRGSPSKLCQRSLFSSLNGEEVKTYSGRSNFLETNGLETNIWQPRRPLELKPSTSRPIESYPRHTAMTDYVDLNGVDVPLELWMDDDDEDDLEEAPSSRNGLMSLRCGKILTQYDCIEDRELREQYQNYRFVCEQGGLIPNSRMMQLLGQETVNLANQNLGDDNLKSILLGKVLNECCKTLELKKNGLSGNSGFLLAEYITPSVEVKGLPQLTSLGLADNRLGVEGGVALMKAISFAPILQHLNLKNNMFTDEVAVSLLESIGSWSNQDGRHNLERSNLRHLDMSYNEIGDDGATAISKLIKSHSSMVNLNLNFNVVTSKGLRDICDCFGKNPCIQTLQLAYNALDTIGGIYIAEIIARCEILRILDVRQNRIGTQAAVFIAEATRMTRNLRVLRLGGNPFSCIGVNSILSNLNAMPRINIDSVSLAHCVEAEPETYTPVRILKEQVNGYIYNLSLTDPIQRCIAELLRARTTLASGCMWIEPNLDGKPLNLQRIHMMPREGFLSFTLVPGHLGIVSSRKQTDDDSQSSLSVETPDPIPDEDLVRERMTKLEGLDLLTTFKKINQHLSLLKSTIQEMFKSDDKVLWSRERWKDQMDRYGCRVTAEEVDSIFRLVGWATPGLDEQNVEGIEANDLDNAMRAFKRDVLTLSQFGVTNLKKFIRNVHVPMIDPPTLMLNLDHWRDRKLLQIINSTDALVTDHLCKTPWKNVHVNGMPSDFSREYISNCNMQKKSRVEFDWHDRTIYMTQSFVWKLSNFATRADAAKQLQAQVLLADKKEIQIRDFVTKKQHNETVKLSHSESAELLKSLLVYDPDVSDRPPVVNLPSVGEISYRITPSKPVVLFAEEWDNMQLEDPDVRTKINEQHRRCFSELGESIVHFYVNKKVVWPIMTDRFTLSESGSARLTFVMLRPRGMLKSMQTYDYEFDLSVDLDRHKAMFLRGFVVHSQVPQRPLWRDTTWQSDSGERPREIHFVEICTPSLWEMPDYGILKCTFVAFQTNRPMQASVFKFICALIEETTSECERLRVISSIFQSNIEADQKERARDPFWITAKMAKQIVYMFNDKTTKDEAYHHMRVHVIDPENAIDLEGVNTKFDDILGQEGRQDRSSRISRMSTFGSFARASSIFKFGRASSLEVKSSPRDTMRLDPRIGVRLGAGKNF